MPAVELSHFTSFAPKREVDLLSGRLIELSGRGASANLTAAFGLVYQTQRQGEQG